jgi:hypothetical protein
MSRWWLEKRGLRGLPWLVASIPLLALARLAPETGAGLWLRLAAATLVLLLPGRLVARAIGRRSGSAALTWTVAAIAASLALTFAVHGSLVLTVGILALIAIVALPFSARAGEEPAVQARALVVLAGIGFGIALWHVAGIVHGDALFHLGRVRKLDELGGLSLRAVDEFRDGGLHPGYAFPLWHGFLALVAKLAGVDPGEVVLHEPTVLAPVAFLVVFESGLAVFRSAWAGAAVLLATIALYALAPGEGGSYATLALPATVARQLLVPVLVAGFFAVVRQPSWSLAATVAAASVNLALVHPTYALFLALPLTGFVAVRILVARRDLLSAPGALALVGAPAALVFAWLAPIVAETASHNPSAVEKRRAFHQYASQLDVFSLHRYRLAPEVVGRSGAVAVAALALVPLAGLAARRRWSALVLGGSLVVLGLELWTLAFPRFSDAVSISQARRAAGFVPFAFAFAGGWAVLARLGRWLVLPAALAAGIVLQQRYPGDFGRELVSGGPALVAWIALWGGLVGLAVALVLARRRGPLDRTDWLVGAASFLFVLPVAVHGFSSWRPSVASDGHALTPGLVQALRTTVPKRAVVYADLETSYRISAAAPVYVADAPPAHVADTKANRPYARRRELIRFLKTGDLAIPRRYGAGWLVLRRGELPGLQRRLPRAYADREFVLLRLR